MFLQTSWFVLQMESRNAKGLQRNGNFMKFSLGGNAVLCLKIILLGGSSLGGGVAVLSVGQRLGFQARGRQLGLLGCTKALAAST